MKILIIGLGGIGQRHARNLRAFFGDSLQLLAYRVRGLEHVITPTLQISTERTVEQEHGIRVFNDLKSALAEKPQAAFICNPSSLHVETALQCADAGCDLFIEKPLSNSLADVETLISKVESNGLVAMVGYQLRFHPCVERLRSIVASGVLGGIVAVRAVVGEFLPGWHRYEDYRTMYAARADLGGGVILSQIHELDYLFSMFGVPRRLFALGGQWTKLELDVEDTASILMENSFNGRPLPIHVQLDYLQTPARRQCDIVGENGKVSMDLIANSVTLYCEQQSEPDVTNAASFERNQLFIDELKHFIRCVETRERPITDLRAGMQSLRMALAAKQSIANGGVVELNVVHGPERAGA